eukprot:m.173970 g.173970  ORF g.173970 m.173970 type:complete len:80 (-) comp16745_c0_seq17:2488-2727(-)
MLHFTRSLTRQFETQPRFYDDRLELCYLSGRQQWHSHTDNIVLPTQVPRRLFKALVTHTLKLSLLSWPSSDSILLQSER